MCERAAFLNAFEEGEEAIIALRQARRWAPKKIAVALAMEWPLTAIPAASTIGDILKRSGFVVPRKLRRHSSPSAQPLAHAVECNVVWCMDFKGRFRTVDGRD